MKKILLGILFVGFMALLGITPVYAFELIHEVQAGESMADIAAQYDITVEEILAINNMTIDQPLIAGQELNVGKYDFGSKESDLISAEENVGTPLAPSPDSNSEEITFIEYTVQTNDTLRSIAYQFGVTVKRLQLWNNLESDIIYPGDKIKVPNFDGSVPSRSGANMALRLLEMADTYIGTPYKYGGSSPGGFDCSGFSSYMFRQVGIELPHNAAAQYQYGVEVPSDELTLGDLVFFKQGRGIDHVGIYAGNDQFIHSSSPRNGGVIYSSLVSGYYASYYVGARRVIN